MSIGEPLRTLTLEEFAPPALLPATGVFRLLSGSLPLGVELRTDGSFSGAPTASGIFTARIEACRPAPPSTCVTTTLTVTVTGQPLPRTGPTAPLGRTVAAAAALSVLGSLLLGGAGRRRAARP